jgi:hypothetical protein
MIAALRTGLAVWLFTFIVGCILVPFALAGIKLEGMDLLLYVAVIIPTIMLLSMPSLAIHLAFNLVYHWRFKSGIGLVLINLLAGMTFTAVCLLYFGEQGFSWFHFRLCSAIILLGNLLAFFFLYKIKALPTFNQIILI